MAITNFTQQEVEYLRGLAREVKELSLTPENDLKRQNWYDINDLKEGAKPVFINHYWPVALAEIIPPESYVCSTELGKYFETYLRSKIYYVKELGDDNVVEPLITCPMMFELKDYADIDREVNFSSSDTHGETAYEIVPVINNEEDIEKLTAPVFSFDEEKSLAQFRETQEIFEPILTVVKHPMTFAAKIPDEYSWLRGLQNTYMDMYDDPEWMHEALGKIADNFKKRFHLVEEAGIWGTVDHSEPLGSAGLRYTTGLPDYRDVADGDFFHHKVKLEDSWGFTCAEVFHCVSSSMHDEFGIAYDRDVMDMFRFINVGCCEVLDKKMELVRTLPNTRKVSVAEWCDVENAANEIKRDYVYSYRAAGVHFVGEQWDKEAAEKEIRGVLEAAKKHGCNVEIVLNIGGSIGEKPIEKTKEWSQLVRDLINEYYA